jgi:opacity protein-like surface antigen
MQRRMDTRCRAAALAVGLSTLLAPQAQAAEWQHEVAPYLWGAAISGTTAIGPVSADVDASFGDILDSLEMGFMGTYRATRDRVSITVDGIYMGLGGAGRGPAGFVEADVDLDQSALEVDVGYEILDRLIVFGGIRYNDLSVEIKTTGPLGTRSESADEDWIDPVIGAHYTIDFADRWSFTLRGDIGGFGVGSEFAWQGVGTLRWQATDRVGVLGAYRYIDMDYESDDRSREFKYDMSMSGPALGVVFTF